MSKGRTRAERANRRREREELDVAQDPDRLPSVGKGRFFEDPKKYQTDLSFLIRWGSNASWTDEQMQLAHANVARLAGSKDASISLRAYDLMRKTIVETARAQLELAKFELVVYQRQTDGQSEEQLNVDCNSQIDSYNGDCSDDRVLQIAKQLGIEISIIDETASS